MSKGHFSRHLNKIRNIYSQRKNTLVKLLRANFPKEVLKIYGEDAGLHFMISINNSMSEKELIETAKNKGVKVTGLSKYYISKPQKLEYPMLILGYSGLNEIELENAVNLLKLSWLDKN